MTSITVQIEEQKAISQKARQVYCDEMDRLMDLYKQCHEHERHLRYHQGEKMAVEALLPGPKYVHILMDKIVAYENKLQEEFQQLWDQRVEQLQVVCDARTVWAEAQRVLVILMSKKDQANIFEPRPIGVIFTRTIPFSPIL
jgi:hypothetical protein